jgi:hypothetical protein
MVRRTSTKWLIRRPLSVAVVTERSTSRTGRPAGAAAIPLERHGDDTS